LVYKTQNKKDKTMTKTQETIVTARAKAFSTFPISTYRFLVDADGTVRVWDKIAGHYTTCHALSFSAQRRIRKLAADN
jgi:hypothetical protein